MGIYLTPVVYMSEEELRRLEVEVERIRSGFNERVWDTLRQEFYGPTVLAPSDMVGLSGRYVRAVIAPGEVPAVRLESSDDPGFFSPSRWRRLMAWWRRLLRRRA